MSSNMLFYAKDDPFAATEILPDEADLGVGVRLELTKKGGHLGFVSKGRGLDIKYWITNRIMRYLANK